MNEQNLEKNIKANVLEMIRGGRVHIRPKFYFAARFIITILVALLALGISVFVVSFVFFSIHESGEQFLLGFGGRGFLTFLFLFPWTAIILDIIILFLLEWLIQGFKFGHRVSLLTIFLYIFVGSTIIGFLINFTPIHKTLLKLADQGSLPIIGEMYESLHDSHMDQGIFRGNVISKQGNEIIIMRDDKDRDGDEINRTVTLPPNSPIFNIGDSVYIFGSSTGERVGVTGIQKFPPEQ